METQLTLFDNINSLPCEVSNSDMRYYSKRSVKKSSKPNPIAMPQIKYSDEQQAIIDAFAHYNRIRINAYAGSGKTTTLLEIARNYPNENFLIVCFNKSIADELQRKYSFYGLKNITAKTLHALAYHNLMRAKGGKVRVVNNADMIKRLHEQNISEDIRQVITAYKVYESFCNSEHTEITFDTIKQIIRRNKRLYSSIVLSQVYSIIKEHEKRNLAYDFSEIHSKVLKEVVSDLTNLVQEIDSFIMSPYCDVITHAGYLKFMHRYVAKHHKIPGNYTAIMIDEAQDINGIMIDIIQNLEIPKKVAVGDKHQSIYGWNDAINALAQLHDWQEFYLTTSFRFKNPEIVQLANNFLQNIKLESRLMRQAEKVKDLSGFAYITRSNAAIMEHIAKIEHPFKLTRSVDSIFEPLLMADQIIKYYSKKEKMNDKVPEYIKKIIENCTTFDNFIETIKNVDVETYETLNRVYQMANRGIFVKQVYFKAMQMQDPESDYTITTAHTAKGLEYKEIELANDFPTYNEVISDFVNENGEKIGSVLPETFYINIIEGHRDFADIIDQINLQYVAITRASEIAKGEGLKTITDNFAKNLRDVIELSLPQKD